MKIETIQSSVITDWVDVQFNGTTHYEVHPEDRYGRKTWVVSECGYSGHDSRTCIESKARAVAIALTFLADDILKNDWADEHHSELILARKYCND